MSADYDAYFELLTVPQQQAIARGDVTIEELLERVTSDTEAELCPRCARASVSPRYARVGLCSACAVAAMADAHQEKVYELEAERERTNLKKRVQRLRDEIDPDRPRRPGPRAPSSADAGRVWITTAWPMCVQCDACGRSFTPRDGTATCPSCTGRKERRQ